MGSPHRSYGDFHRASMNKWWLINWLDGPRGALVLTNPYDPQKLEFNEQTWQTFNNLDGSKDMLLQLGWTSVGFFTFWRHQVRYTWVWSITIAPWIWGISKNLEEAYSRWTRARLWLLPVVRHKCPSCRNCGRETWRRHCFTGAVNAWCSEWFVLCFFKEKTAQQNKYDDDDDVASQVGLV